MSPENVETKDPLSEAIELLDFVVVGTGRCGSGYASHILRACGLPTGHESIFSAFGVRPVPYRVVGDSSWLAVPYLEPSTELKLIHLVRDPIRVVRSLVGIRFFSDPIHGHWRNFALRHMPELPVNDDLTAAIKWTLGWNERCAQLSGHDESRRVRLESLTTIEAVQGLVGLAGGQVGSAQAAQALNAVPRNYNARTRGNIGWSDIPKNDLGEQLRKLAVRYGYTVPK